MLGKAGVPAASYATVKRRRGVVDFSNPTRIEPFFDIEAETRMRSYRVHLRMNGTLDRWYVSGPLGVGNRLLAARLDGARHLDGAAEQQQLFGQRGLAGVGVRDDRKGTAFEVIGGCHDGARLAASGEGVTLRVAGGERQPSAIRLIYLIVV